MDGFLLVISTNGEILFASESIKEFIGIFQVVIEVVGIVCTHYTHTHTTHTHTHTHTHTPSHYTHHTHTLHTHHTHTHTHHMHV